MGFKLLIFSFIGFLVSLDFHITGSIIDDMTYGESKSADILKIGSFILAFSSFQMGLVGLILILVS